MFHKEALHHYISDYLNHAQPQKYYLEIKATSLNFDIFTKYLEKI